MERRDAEAMTSYLTETIILDRGRLAEKFVHKADLEKVRFFGVGPRDAAPLVFVPSRSRARGRPSDPSL